MTIKQHKGVNVRKQTNKQKEETFCDSFKRPGPGFSVFIFKRQLCRAILPMLYTKTMEKKKIFSENRSFRKRFLNRKKSVDCRIGVAPLS